MWHGQALERLHAYADKIMPHAAASSFESFKLSVQISEQCCPELRLPVLYALCMDYWAAITAAVRVHDQL